MEFFKSPVEMLDVLQIIRVQRKDPVTQQVFITGSTATGGTLHHDVDVLVVKKGSCGTRPFEHVEANGWRGSPLHIFVAYPNGITDPKDQILFESLHGKGRVVFTRR